MSIMICPRCEGTGTYSYNGGRDSGDWRTGKCLICEGKGYVTDIISPSLPSFCPKCGKRIEPHTCSIKK